MPCKLTKCIYFSLVFWLRLQLSLPRTFDRLLGVLRIHAMLLTGSSSFQTLDLMWALGIDCTLIMVKTVNFKARLDWGASLSGCSGMRFAGYASAEIRCLERRDKNQREIKDCGMSIHVISYGLFFHLHKSEVVRNGYFYISNVLLIDINKSCKRWWHLAPARGTKVWWPPLPSLEVKGLPGKVPPKKADCMICISAGWMMLHSHSWMFAEIMRVLLCHLDSLKRELLFKQFAHG